MSESCEQYLPSFAAVAERQGLEVGARASDYRLELAPGGQQDPDSYLAPLYYAVPKWITALNPLTGVRQSGELTESGAFVDNNAKIAGETNMLDRRVLVLGRSLVSNSSMCEGSVVNDAVLTSTVMFANASVDRASTISGSPDSPILIGRRSKIGRWVKIAGNTRVHGNVVVGDCSDIIDSTLSPRVTIEPSPPSIPLAIFSYHRTVIKRSFIGAGAQIGQEAQILDSHLDRKSVVASGASIEFNIAQS